MTAPKFAQMLALATTVVVFLLHSNAKAEECYTAVYDQKPGEGTYSFIGRGTWDPMRNLCHHVTSFTKTFVGKNATGVETARSRPFVHVMYVIDRGQNRFYAPCGAVANGGVLNPGVYDLTSFSRISAAMPDLGQGAYCTVASTTTTTN